ncbi:beta-hydroxysteroid dehydrogenase [Grosmannia clavigera kw1407]|uniref:Beta-hydroxysteroid dehydrogenase n=1 Tax=Grosmannia clavigera (strain kw1407 / UAMH 11150) TaxID=655863 RepID=F0XGI2_GROCL|nr:beta-hydroxysteroid dehydrogenase [Grosmannia clavigera kw1407]EFX03208.1 beta-hydroxysteroid dehydrogenase [Grosmannia clavigera kw1407]
MTSPYIPGRLDGKVAVVTGAGRGIGAAIALQLGELGADVVVNYAHSPEAANTVAAKIKMFGCKAYTFQADVRNVADTVRLFNFAVESFGKPLDIVVSNAGVVSFGHLKDVTEEEYDRIFNLNTRGQFFVAREGYRTLRGDGGGRIILTSSNTSRDFSVPHHSLYSGSKGAIDSFVRILSKDCGDKNITVNAVAPGGTVTDMFHTVSHRYIPGSEKYTAEERQKMAAFASPLNRNGFPEDVARVVAFLASKDGEWINGKVLTLDGGAA